MLSRAKKRELQNQVGMVRDGMLFLRESLQLIISEEFSACVQELNDLTSTLIDPSKSSPHIQRTYQETSMVFFYCAGFAAQDFSLVSWTCLRLALQNASSNDRYLALQFISLVSHWDEFNERFANRLDYMIARLASEEVQGCLKLTQDPSDLCEVLQQRAVREREHLNVKAVNDCAAIRTAAESIEQGTDTPSIHAQISQIRQTIGPQYYNPSILRAFAEYNIAMTQYEEEEILDDNLKNALPSGNSPPDTLQGHSPGTTSRPTNSRPLCLATLNRIVNWLVTSILTPAEAADGPFKNFQPVRIHELSAREMEAFKENRANSVDDDLRHVVALRNLLDNGERNSELLAPFDLNWKTLFNVWLKDFEELLSKHQKEFICAAQYEDAKTVAETKARHLAKYMARRRRAVSVRQEGPPVTQVPESIEIEEIEKPLARPTRKDRFLTKKKPAKSANKSTTKDNRPAKPKQRRSLHLKGIASFAIMAIATGLVLQTFVLPPLSNDFTKFDKSKLHEYSVFLTSGYRDKNGRFFGEMTDMWAQIKPEDQHLRAEEIAQRFNRDGMKDLTIFDRYKRIVLRYSDGKMHVPSRQQ